MNAKVPSLKKCEMSLDLLLLYFFKYVTVCKQKNVLVLQKIPENSICVQNQIMLLKVVQIGLKRGTSRISMYKVQQLNISSLMYKIHASIRVATLKVECTSGYSGGLCKWRFLHFGNWEIYPKLTKYLECIIGVIICTVLIQVYTMHLYGSGNYRLVRITCSKKSLGFLYLMLHSLIHHMNYIIPTLQK